MVKRKIESIEGIGPAYAEKLARSGIDDTDRLLEACCDPAGRQWIAEATGIEAKRILKWVNMADLCRINGVGPEFAELLEGAGVDTVKELGTRNPENLAAKLAEVNKERNLTRRVPSAMVVGGWVDDARALAPLVTY